MSADDVAFRQGMRALATGVTLVTTAHEGVRRGLTASAVCSLCATPPLLLVCVNKSALAHDVIFAANAFCVNILANHHGDLARLFADAAAAERRFDEGRWRDGAMGVPVLEDALASFECKLDLAVEKATHTIFIGAVEEVRVGAGEPLLYFGGSFRNLSDVTEGVLP